MLKIRIETVKKPISHKKAQDAYDTIKRYCEEQVAINDHCKTCIFDTRDCRCECIVGCPGDWLKPKAIS